MYPKLLKSGIICATFLSLFQLSNVLFWAQVDSVIVSLMSHLYLISVLVFHSSIKNLLRLPNMIPDPVKHHSLNRLQSPNAKLLNIFLSCSDIWCGISMQAYTSQAIQFNYGEWTLLYHYWFYLGFLSCLSYLSYVQILQIVTDDYWVNAFWSMQAYSFHLYLPVQWVVYVCLGERVTAWLFPQSSQIIWRKVNQFFTISLHCSSMDKLYSRSSNPLGRLV